MNELKRESQIERDLIIICRSIIRRVVYRRERFKSHRVEREHFFFLLFFRVFGLKSTPKKKKDQDQEKDGPEESALK